MVEKWKSRYDFFFNSDFLSTMRLLTIIDSVKYWNFFVRSYIHVSMIAYRMSVRDEQIHCETKSKIFMYHLR